MNARKKRNVAAAGWRVSSTAELLGLSQVEATLVEARVAMGRAVRAAVKRASVPEPRIQSVQVTDEAIVATFSDGRVVSVPLHWSYRLEVATPAQRRNYYLSGRGYGAHWPDIDEDLSAQGFFTGTPAPRGTVAHRRYMRDHRAGRSHRVDEPVVAVARKEVRADRKRPRSAKRV